MGAKKTVSVAGHRLTVSNLDKVLYPATGTTKADVIAYYQAVAHLLVPQVAWRPVTRKRWPDGVGDEDEPGEVFFSKNLESYAPQWIARFPIQHSRGTSHYPLANDAGVLAWFGQVAALELHTPQWRFDVEGAPSNPDRLVLDLDPGPGAGLPHCAQVARLCRELLDEMGMPSFPVTSGSKGIHLYAALTGAHTSEQVSAVAKELARALEADHRDLVVSTQKKTARTGKVLVDWSQNSAAKTTIAPYSLRGRTQPTVAAPRTWEEIDDPHLAHLDYREVLERLDLDLLAPLGLAPRAMGRPDRLTVYRSMRDRSRTPEPVPSAAEVAEREGLGGSEEGSPPIFVIQEHHARRLHWDVRLEHDGVLVSWAVPKGPPTTTTTNRLAVPTEDHPLEYASFEGTIPAGEYGAGEMTIWDAGTYEVEKWRENEVIATLIGRPDGGLGGEPYRFALIRTHTGKEKASWLMHKMERSRGARNVAAPGRVTSGRVSASRATSGPARASAPSPTRSGLPRRVSASRATSGPARASASGPTRSGLPTIEPMLATLGALADLRAADEWWYEMKWDGVRAVVSVDCSDADPTVSVRGRSGSDVTLTYPEVAQVAQLVNQSCVLDGEIVALRHGRPDFSLLQQRIGLTDPGDVATAARRTPVVLVVFDVLHLDGRSLLREPYTARRACLVELLGEGTEAVWVPEAVPPGTGAAQHAMSVSADLKLEGIVAKKAQSTYQQGRRARTWVKVKHTFTQAVVVIGWRASTARTFASLLLAVPDDEGTLHYAGRVGTGFTDAQMRQIAQRLAPLERPDTPVQGVLGADRRDATWVLPSLVGEVSHAGRTETGSLRHAVWRGWREDVDPAQVTWELP